MATIPLDELAPGATVRFTVVDGVQYLSVRDFIMHMCGKNINDAGEVWRNLSEDKKKEVRESVLKFKFPGRGQSEQPVITFPGAIKLAMFLPGEKAKKNRALMTNIIIKYFAGDSSLCHEVYSNAQSDQPAAQMARASLQSHIIGKKRYAEDELEIEERAVAVERQKAETAQLISQTRMKQLEMFNNATESYNTLCCRDSFMDERARLIFKDTLLNLVAHSGQAAITADASTSAAGFLTISTVATDLGHRFDSSQLKRLGGKIAQAYFHKYKKPPTKHEQFVDGAVRYVNTYEHKERELVENEIRAFAARN